MSGLLVDPYAGHAFSAIPGTEVLHGLIDQEGGKMICERDAAQGLDEEELSLRVDLEEDRLAGIGQLHIEDPHDQSKLTERRAQALLQLAVERVGAERHVPIHPPVELLGRDEGAAPAVA